MCGPACKVLCVRPLVQQGGMAAPATTSAWGVCVKGCAGCGGSGCGSPPQKTRAAHRYAVVGPQARGGQVLEGLRAQQQVQVVGHTGRWQSKSQGARTLKRARARQTYSRSATPGWVL